MEKEITIVRTQGSNGPPTGFVWNKQTYSVEENINTILVPGKRIYRCRIRGFDGVFVLTNDRGSWTIEPESE